MGKVNTSKELENSWIRWASLVALLSTVLKEAIKRLSSRSCWIIFFRCFWQESTHFAHRWKGLIIRSLLSKLFLFCFVLFTVIHFVTYTIGQWIPLGWVHCSIFFPLRVYPGLGKYWKKKNKTKILQWWDRGDIYNNLCCKIHSTIRICVKLFDHSHSVNNNNNKMLLVDNNISS